MTDIPGNDGAPNGQVTGPRISVIGIGGAGGNAINNMIEANLEGVEFLVANTDAQALAHSLCENKLQLGATSTQGLGAGSRPELGQVAAEEAREQIVEALKGANMAFLTAGMGGGTGTGGAPVIARAARDEGVLTVGVVTKPFNFEGPRRMRQAEAGIAELSQYVDTLIVIPNQNLFRVADAKTTFADAFKMADEVLHSGVRGVTDLMVLPGLVNLDFADVRSIMAGMGNAVMGTGEAEGDDRALAAAEAAISNPLLDDVSMTGARSVLINITGGADLMLMEVDAAANRVREEVDPDAHIIFGSAFSDKLDGKIRVSVIATGAVAENSERVTPRSSGPFVGQQTTSDDTTRAAPVRADEAPQPAAADNVPSTEDEGKPPVASAQSLEMRPLEMRPADEPLTLRLVSSSPETDIEAEAPSAVSQAPEPAPEPADTKPADSFHLASTFLLDQEEPITVDPIPDMPPEETSRPKPGTVPGSTLAFMRDQEGSATVAPIPALPSDEAAEPEPMSKPAPAFLLRREDEATVDPIPGIPSEETAKPETTFKPTSIFRNRSRPVKTESTLETHQSGRAQEEPPEAEPEKMHFVVWEAELGARIYKVPERKLVAVQSQPHADKLKLFDSLDNAKAEANVIFKRIAAERTAKGLSRSILEPTLKDLMRWDENSVPPYFL